MDLVAPVQTRQVQEANQLTAQIQSAKTERQEAPVWDEGIHQILDCV
jgi:hypothetical protein